jgi:hypothetical protein
MGGPQFCARWQTNWILGRSQILTVSGQAVVAGSPYLIALDMSKDVALAQYDAKSLGHCSLDS